MFIFLKLVYPADVVVNTNPPLSKKINDVKPSFRKQLLSELFEIEENFNLMERHFDAKFNELIFEKQKELNISYSQKKEEQETKEQHIPNVVSDEYFNSLSQILAEIVFDKFMDFYEGFSYALNEQVIRRYKKFERIKETFSDRKDMNLISDTIDRGFENIYYRDFYYFHDRLEKKLALILDIRVSTIRSILYGCDPNDKESHMKQIQQYYRIISNYKLYWCDSNAGNDKFFNCPYFTQKDSINQNKAIEASMRKYIHYFKKDPSYLYDYYRKIPIISFIPPTRFYLYKKFLIRYGDWDNIPSDFAVKNRELISDYHHLAHYGAKTVIRSSFSKYISYEKNENFLRYYIGMFFR